jgi:hypothetical protein
MSFLPSSQLALGVSLLGILSIAWLAKRLYSVFFGPLAKFPGPKLAAFTLWYEFYYDVVLSGRYTFKIKELHEKYGTVSPSCFAV